MSISKKWMDPEVLMKLQHAKYMAKEMWEDGERDGEGVINESGIG
jgi:hypothetical protein